MKILFLDIDGVLTNEALYTKQPETLDDNYILDRVCVERINKICEATNAQIVISSTWRLNMGRCYRVLKQHGLRAKIIGRTEYLRTERGVEVAKYLATAKPEAFVIIDDDSDFDADLTKHLVLTKNVLGIQDTDVEKAIKILNNEDS